VGPPGVSVPAATRGSSAFAPATLFSVQPFSALSDPAHLPNPFVPAVFRICVFPAVPLPTACQWNPPAPVVASLTALAAKIMSLLPRPIPLGSSSYHTVDGTVSLGPVNAMSGATLLRVGSMLSVGSPVDDDCSAVGFNRCRPVCCQQKEFTGAPPAGGAPVN